MTSRAEVTLNNKQAKKWAALEIRVLAYLLVYYVIDVKHIISARTIWAQSKIS